MANGKLTGSQDETKDQQLEALVEKASKGDKDALCELCESIAKGVLFKVTYILGGRPSSVEDVSQEVLIRVCENIENLRSPKAFKAWLGRIIINEKNRYLSKNIRQAEVLDIDDYLEEPSEESEDFIPQEYVENRELRGRVMQAIKKLPMRQRETIILHYYDGFSVTEVARILDVTTQSVSKNLGIAREKLKKELGAQMQPGGYLGAAALPIGVALGELLQRESLCFAAGEACIQSIVTRCGQLPIPNTAQIAGVFSTAPTTFEALACVCATAFAAAAITWAGRQVRS